MTSNLRPRLPRPRQRAALLLAFVVTLGGCSWLEIFARVQDMRVTLSVTTEGALPQGYDLEVATRSSRRIVPLVAGLRRFTVRVPDHGTADVTLTLRDASGSATAAVVSRHSWTRGDKIFAGIHFGLQDPGFEFLRDAKVALPPPSADSAFLCVTEDVPVPRAWC